MNTRINKKYHYLISIFLIVLVLSSSIPLVFNKTQVHQETIRRDKPHQVVKVEEISIYVGERDYSVDTSLTTYLSYFGEENIKFNFLKDLQSQIFDKTLIIFAHGDKDGILGKEGDISWAEIGQFISNSQIQNVILGACDGSELAKYIPEDITIFSKSGQIDAIEAGIAIAANTYLLHNLNIENKANEFLDDFIKRNNELSQGDQFLPLSRRYMIYTVGNWFYAYGEFWVRLTGSDATKFWGDVGAIGAWGAFFGVLSLLSQALAGLSIFFSLFSFWLVVQSWLITQFSNPGEVAFGIKDFAWPIPMWFYAYGYPWYNGNWPAGVIEAQPIYAAMVVYDTYQVWRYF